MWNSRFEVPEFRRCCFCIPIRRGLLAWSYIKMILLLLVALVITSELKYIFRASYSHNKANFIMPMIVAFLMLLEILFTGLCIVFGHMKNVKGLNMYYYYSLGMLITFTVVYTVMLIVQIVSIGKYISFPFFWMYIIQNVVGFFMAVVVELYVLLIVRSEVIKLRNNTNFRFTNQEAGNVSLEKDTLTAYEEAHEDAESRTGNMVEGTYY